MIAFLCSGCGKSLKVKDEFAGRKGKCPHCQQPMTVPTPTEVATQAKGPSGAEAYSEADAKTVLPPSLDIERDLKTVLPAVPRGKSSLKKGSTLAPGQPRAPKQSVSESELTDFLAPAQAPDEIGRLGDYRVLKVLGAGGMGVVFQAEDPALKRLVALKVMLPALAASASNKERFLREAQAAAAIEHDHIVHIYQVAEDRNVPFIAMQFLKGEPLEDRLKREGALPREEVLRIGKETAEGLAAAHDRGLIHRDIKPANVWLEGERGRVKILDFGLARSSGGDSHLTQQGAIIGTPAYMAPEQGAGKAVDSRCDLFSLGCMLYRMATGQLPFKGADTVSTIVAVATETPQPPRKLNPDISPRLSKLIMDLLAKAPDDRPPSAHTVIDVIEELEREAPPDRTAVDEPPPVRVRIVRDAGRNRDDEATIQAEPDIAEVLPAGEEEPAARSSMLPWLIAGGAGVFVLLLAVVITIVVVVVRKKEPEVAQTPTPATEKAPMRPNDLNPRPIINPPPRVNPNPPIDPPNEDKKGPPEPVIRPTPRPKPKENEAEKTFKPYNNSVGGLAFASDGNHFVAFGDNKSTVDYWDLDGKLVRQFNLGGKVEHVHFSADGSQMGAYNDSRLMVWDTESAKPLAVLLAPRGSRIVGLGFTADREFRAALTAQTIVQFFDCTANKFLPGLKVVVVGKRRVTQPLTLQHQAGVRQVLFAPNATKVVTWSEDHILRSWDLETKEMVPTPTTTFPVAPGNDKALVMSRDGKRILGSFNQPNVLVYDVAAGTELRNIKPPQVFHTEALAFSFDNALAVSGAFGGDVALIDLASGDIKKQFKVGAWVKAVALSPDGKTILVGEGGNVQVFKVSAKAKKPDGDS